jgi:2-polyprenyl-6-hydroxyphenyl methylase/3-demethylubiquinone-9 3-methyltransferase
MHRLGAKVTGIDASKRNIHVAEIHAKKNNLKIKYINTSPEKLNTDKKFDIILNMEIVEHVKNLDLFLNISSNLLSKSGIMFVATINRSLKSYAFAIIGAEYILRWLPIGTHDWDKFVTPNELINLSDKNKLKLISIDGVKFNPFINGWKISKDKSVNYISCFEKK